MVDAVLTLVVAKGTLRPGVASVLALCRPTISPWRLPPSTEYRLIDVAY